MPLPKHGILFDAKVDSSGDPTIGDLNASATSAGVWISRLRMRSANGLGYETSDAVDLGPPVDGAAEKKIMLGNNPIIINR